MISTNSCIFIVALSALLLVNNVYSETDKKYSDRKKPHENIERTTESIRDWHATVLTPRLGREKEHSDNVTSHRHPRLLDDFLEYENEEDAMIYRDPKIIGGKPDITQAINYQVTIHNGIKDICGATIIADRYLLSTANCFIDKDNNPNAGEIYVLIGTNKMSDSVEDVPKVRTVYVPVEFDATHGPERKGDIAVLKLSKELGLNKDPRISKVDLPKPLKNGSYQLYEGKEGIVAGYGASYLEYEDFTPEFELKVTKTMFPKRLIIADVDILKQSNCQKKWSPIEVTSSQMCGRIQGLGYRGICVGDTGNGLVHKNTLIGVVSLGYVTCNEGYRHAGKPALYTRVSSYIDMIEDAMADKISNKIRSFDIPIIVKL